jgi:hypothetical protein
LSAGGEGIWSGFLLGLRAEIRQNEEIEESFALFAPWREVALCLFHGAES